MADGLTSKPFVLDAVVAKRVNFDFHDEGGTSEEERMAQAQYRYRGQPPYRPPRERHVCVAPATAPEPLRFPAEPIAQLIAAQREQGAMVDAEEQRRRLAMWDLGDPPEPEPEPVTDGFTCFVQMQMAGSVFGKALPADPPDRDKDEPELYRDKLLLHRAVQYGQQYRSDELLPLVHRLMDALAQRFTAARAPVMRDFAAALAVHHELEADRCPNAGEATSAWTGNRLPAEGVALTLYDNDARRAHLVCVEPEAAALLRLVHTVLHLGRYTATLITHEWRSCARPLDINLRQAWAALATEPYHQRPVSEWGDALDPFPIAVYALHAAVLQVRAMLEIQ